MNNNDSLNEGLLSTDQKKELDSRLNDYENGVGKTYTWDEIVVMTDQALAATRK